MTVLPDDDLLDEVLPCDQQEEEADLKKQVSFQDAVVQTADWTVGTLHAQLAKGTIDLDPGFQRRQAWDNVRKARLIESLIAGLPIPNIVLADNTKHRGRFLVIDGKQRLLTIRDYLDNGFALKGLDLRPDLEGKTFDQLPVEDREYLENNSIRATIIKNIADPDFLYVLFFRLNSGSLQLSPQELRRALIGGSALNAIDNYIQNSEIFHAFFGPVLDRRMRDSELVLRFIAFDRSYEAYAGNLKEFLDNTVDYFEKNWQHAEAELISAFVRLDLSLKTAEEIFGQSAFKKWTGTRYERRINRAVFDVITRFFSDSNIAAAATANAQAINDSYKEVCDLPAFRGAIEKTTKTVDATRLRMNIWGNALAHVLGLTYDEINARIR